MKPDAFGLVLAILAIAVFAIAFVMLVEFLMSESKGRQ